MKNRKNLFGFAAIAMATMVVLVGFTPCSKAYAQTAVDFTYDLNKAGDGIVIRKYTGPGGTVRVPETIEGYPVVEIGERAFVVAEKQAIVAVVLPLTITTIGESAFVSRSNLKTINLPPNLMTIGDDAFSGCRNLTAINLPPSLKTIGLRAFSECTSLTAVNLPSSLKIIARYAFQATALTEVKIPEGVEIIDADAFAYCKKLRSVTLPTSIKAIAGNSGGAGGAFVGCSELTDITIPDSVTAIHWVDRARMNDERKDWVDVEESWSGAGSGNFTFEDDTRNGIFRLDGKLKLTARKRLQELGYKGSF